MPMPQPLLTYLNAGCAVRLINFARTMPQQINPDKKGTVFTVPFFNFNST
jgi:hypothetical protein